MEGQTPQLFWLSLLCIYLTGNVFSLLNQIWTMCVVSGKSPILMLDTGIPATQLCIPEWVVYVPNESCCETAFEY